MLKRKNAGGWVLALVAVILFGGLILRGLSGQESTAPEEPMKAGMVMSGNERVFARDLSAVFENMAAQYLPIIVSLHTNAAPGAESCGLLISHDGYILTSGQNFQIGDSVRVVLQKGRRFAGSVVGSDPATELTLLKISAEDLPFAKFGDSDRLRFGQLVMAIGSAGASTPVVTTAIINTKGRSKVALPQQEDFIHTEMSARANYGGALVNLDGELIGIIQTKPSPNGATAAVPANLAKRIMKIIMEEGEVVRGDIGATAQDIDQNLAQALRLNSTRGALLAKIAANSPAAQAGLRRGDVILQFANVPIANANELENAVAAQKPDTKVTAVIWRDSAKVLCDVIPSKRQYLAEREFAPTQRQYSAANVLGFEVQNLPAEFIRTHKASGVVIAHIDAAQTVLHPGDMIQEIEHRAIRNVRDFHSATENLQTGAVALLLVQRGEKTFFCGVKVQE